MSNSTPLTPQKLKEQLTSLRESIASLETSTSIHAGFAILLTIELSSRGTHYAISNPSTINDADIIALLDATNNNAGKSTIEKDGYPVQLMAAMFAAGGMAASALAFFDKESPNTLSNSVREACNKTMKRCKEVDDGRFYTLLKLLSSDTIDNSALLADISYAYYLYGAEKYAMDQVPMWKRCLDCALITPNKASNESTENHRSYSNPKTVIPLTNMVRIAQSKGNTKRAEELRMWLVCGYTGAIRHQLDNDRSNIKETEDLDKLSFKQLVETFFLRRTSLKEFQNKSLETLLESAEKHFNEYPTPAETASDESKLLYYYLQTQIYYLKEESIIHKEVRQLIFAKKNRLPENEVKNIGDKARTASTAPIKSATTVASITITAAEKTELYNRTHRTVVMQAWGLWKDSKENEFATIGLRDAIKICSTSGDLLCDCYMMLKSQIQRLLDLAMTLQLEKNGVSKKKSSISSDDILDCWGLLLSFVSPLMIEYLSTVVSQNNEISSPTKQHLRSLLATAAQSIISLAWMCEPLKSKFQITRPLLSVTSQCLILCRNKSTKQGSQIKMTATEKSSSFSSKNASESEMESLLLDCSFASVQVRMDMETLLSTNKLSTSEISVDQLTSIAHKATYEIMKCTKVGAEWKSGSIALLSADSKFGTSFQQFISAWSGLYMNPWPFCNLAQGRILLRNARETVLQANKVWGREMGYGTEQLVLDIAEADLESGLTGGFVENAYSLYKQTLDTLISNDNMLGLNELGFGLLKAHCLLGLAKISLVSETTNSEQLARSAIETLKSLETDATEAETRSLICVYAWNHRLLSRFAALFLECSSRQIIAEALIRSSHHDDAYSFLHSAVEVSPQNFEATFALGAFHLRKIISSRSNSADVENSKSEAKTLLLKAAKMDKSSPKPFALLGSFYELQNDFIRAVGCHKKALSIDSSNPISGRGLHRLLTLDEMKPFCEAAVKQYSSVNGWAWRIIGQLRSKHGDYSSAVVCFQKALRCRDVQDPSREMLGVFYFDWKENKEVCEASETWCLLGTCYCHMGKWSGSHRAFHAAHDVSRGNLSPSSSIVWAQVELELGLYDECIQRCNEMIASNIDIQLKRLALFVRGKSVLAMAHKLIREGKYGSSLSHIKAGVMLEGGNFTELKLLGDLYTLCETLPPYVFVDECIFSDNEMIDYDVSAEVKRKLGLLSAGSNSYRQALDVAKVAEVNDDEKNYLMATAATDLGCNLLAQARVLSLALGDGSGGGDATSMIHLNVQYEHLQNIIRSAINAFIYAIDCSPGEAAAWCGVGCALATVDPLKAQHAFSRALQLDNGATEAWSNMGVLFANYDFRSKGSEILDALTSSEDTPLMWICRGLFFESAAEVWHKQVSARETNESKAADAYRAALQMYQHPSALMGLSLTCRQKDFNCLLSNDAVYATLAAQASKRESTLTMSIQQNIEGKGHHLARCANSFMQFEHILDRVILSNGDTVKDTSEIINSLVDDVKYCKNRMGEDISVESKSGPVNCVINFESTPLLHAIRDNVPIICETTEEAIAIAGSISPQNLSNNGNVKAQLNKPESARNALYLNPDSGEEWLAFAKTLVKELCDCSDISNSDHHEYFTRTLSSAKAAAGRAYDILFDSAVYASMISLSARHLTTEGASVDRAETRVVSFVASADAVSDALSLVSWLDQVRHEEANSSVSMQEAFMLDPTNRVAANGLNLM